MNDKEKLEEIKKLFDRWEEDGQSYPIHDDIKKIVYSQNIRKMTLTDKELKEALDIIDKMLEGNESEKQKGSAHAFRKFPYGMGHEQYNLLKKMIKILTQT